VKVTRSPAYFEVASEADKRWDHRDLIRAADQTDVNDDLAARLAREKSRAFRCVVLRAYPVVGDLPKPMLLVLPRRPASIDRALSDWIRVEFRGLAGRGGAWHRKAADLAGMGTAGPDERLVFNKS